MTGAHAIIVQGKGSGGYAYPSITSVQSSQNIPIQQNRVGEIIEPLPQEMQRKRAPLSTLIPECVEAISLLNLEFPPLIIAAGGITTGEDISKCLDLGADAVCVSSVIIVKSYYYAKKPKSLSTLFIVFLIRLQNF